MSGKIIFFLIFVFVTVNAEKGKDNKAKRYKVNLDLPADQRWNDVISVYADLVPLINKALSGLIPPALMPLLEKIANNVDEFLPAPYPDEIRGIANAAGVPVGEIVIPNIMYDLTAFYRANVAHKDRHNYCTSIVAQDDNGNIWHGRNLDYHVTDVLRNLTVEIDFQRNGKTAYLATTYVGYVGILTGQKPGAFTISIDERNDGTVLENILMILLERKADLVPHLLRKTLEEATNFNDAVTQLSKTETIAPAYYIVGGTKPEEGVVITKDRLHARDVWHLNSTSDRWFLVETNYDHWNAPPPDDDRRDPAVAAMKSLGRPFINLESMYKVLSIPPVLNSITTYTTLMSAAHPEMYSTMIRYPKET